MLHQSFEGGKAYLAAYRHRANLATEKVEATKAMTGNKVRLEQNKLYYEAIIESTTAAALATTTLMERTYYGDEDDQKVFRLGEMYEQLGLEQPEYDDNMHGYEAARIACAKTIRRMLNAGERCPNAGLYAELNWDLPDKAIISSKLGLADRLRSRQLTRAEQGQPSTR